MNPSYLLAAADNHYLKKMKEYAETANVNNIFSYRRHHQHHMYRSVCFLFQTPGDLKVFLKIMRVYATKYALLEIFNTYSLKISYKNLHEERNNFNAVCFSPTLKVNSYNYFRNNVKDCSPSQDI